MASRLTINTNSLNVPFVTGTQYRITLDAGFVKEVGNNRTASPANNNLVTFTTNAVPTFSSSVPSNGAFDVVNNKNIVITFNRNIEAGPGTIQLYQADAAVDTLIYTYNMSDPAFVTISTNTVTLKTTGFLRADTPYYLIIDNNAIRDLDNFNYAGSRIAKTVTANGNATTNNTVTKWDNIDSIIFDGAGDYLSVPSSADFGYGTGSFQIEAWIRPTTASQTSVIVDHRPTATEGLYPTLRLQSGVLQYYTNSAVRITGTTITPNTWTFVQVARFAGTTRLYVGGVQVGSDYTDSNTYATAAVKIGVNGVDLSAGFEGYMSDIRILKAPVGLQSIPTRSRVNDEYTVLYVQGGVGDVNSTIFFDTQEESLGFPSLSATMSITSTLAHTGTIAIKEPKRITLNGAMNFALSASGILSVNNITARTYRGNQMNTLFPNNLPFIESSTAGDSYTINISTPNGLIGTQSNGSDALSTFIYTGSLAQVNGLFSTIKYFPEYNLNSTTTYTYDQYKNGVLEVSKTKNITYDGLTATSVDYTFTSSDTWTPTFLEKRYNVMDYIIVGGGGGGGFSTFATSRGQGGGGGGGEELIYTNQTIANQSYAVSIGAGGIGGNAFGTANQNNNSNLAGTNGGNTSFNNHTANGGFGGGFGLVGVRGGNGGNSGNGNLGAVGVYNASLTAEPYSGGSGGGAGGAAGAADSFDSNPPGADDSSRSGYKGPGSVNGFGLGGRGGYSDSGALNDINFSAGSGGIGSGRSNRSTNGFDGLVKITIRNN